MPTLVQCSLLLALALTIYPTVVDAQNDSSTALPRLDTLTSIEELYSRPKSLSIEAIIAQMYASDASSPGQANREQPFDTVSVISYSPFIPYIYYSASGNAERLHLIHYNTWLDEYAGRTITREILEIAILADTATFMPARSPLSYRDIVSIFRYADQWHDTQHPKVTQDTCWSPYSLLGLCGTLACTIPEATRKPKLAQVLDCSATGIRAAAPTTGMTASDKRPLQHILYGPGTASYSGHGGGE